MQEDATGCWLWTAATRPDGYGVFGIGHSKVVRSHALSFTTFNGSINDGFVVDHICRVRSCVNPEHLQQVTRSENSQNLTGAHRDAKVPYRGVHQSRSGTYIASASVAGHRVEVSGFETAEEAAVVAQSLRNKLQTNNLKDKNVEAAED